MKIMLSDQHKDAAIWVDGISKKYLGNSVLDQISFVVNRGESVGIVGPNGAGKSTLIKILLGLVQSDFGTGRLLGTDLSQVSGHPRVSYLPELPGFWPEVSAYEYLNFSRRLQPNLHDSNPIESILATVGLKKRGLRPMGTYSKGMIQRTGIAWAMQRQPELYILDEPMSGLDPRAQAMLREILIAENKKGRTLLISSHSFEDISALCSRVLVLNHHRLEFDGTPEQAFAKLEKDFSDHRGWSEDYE